MESMTARLSASLDRARAESRRLRRMHVGLLCVTLITSASATLLAGITAAQGEALIESWPVTCWIVAAFTASASVCTGLNQGLRVVERLAGAESCLGRLLSLDLASSSGQRGEHELAESYAELVREHPWCA